VNIAELFAKLSLKPDKASFDAADKLISGLKTALIGLAAVAGARALGGMIEDTVELGSHINDLSQSAGTSTDELQVLGYAAKLNSSNMDEMAGTLGKLTKNMAAAQKDGASPAAEAFQALGVKVTDATGQLRPAQDVFEDISINQRKMSNETKRNGLLLDVMGRSALALVPTMNDVADQGMAHFTEEAKALGGVIESDTIAKLDELGDTQDKVKTALTGLRNEAVAALLPTLQKMADGFLEWVKLNRELIKQKLQALFSGLAKALTFVAHVIDKYVIPVIEFMSDHLDAMEVIFGSLVIALGVFKAANIAAAVASGIAWALANIPLLLLMALIAAVVLVVEDLYTAFEGGDSVFKEWLGQDTIDRIHSAVLFLWDAFKGFLGFVKGGVDFLIAGLEKLIGVVQKAGELVGSIVGNDATDAIYRGDKAAINQVTGKGSTLSIGETAGALTQRIANQHAQLASGAASTNTGGLAIQAPVTIQVNGTNLSPDQLGNAISRAMGDFWNGMLQKTAVGVGVKP
jgi:hypothetical protein